MRVEYFDHHFAGDLPVHPNLTALIDPSPDMCTGILVDRHLGGRYRIWAVVAAFGDNLCARRTRSPSRSDSSAPQLEALRELGAALAYNAYADVEADLIVHPSAVYRMLAHYADPFALRANSCSRALRDPARRSANGASRGEPELALPGATVYVLPDEPWSRRVRGASGTSSPIAFRTSRMPF